MKYAKSLGLLAVAAAALMALAATASAATITSSTGPTPTIRATNEGPVTLDGTVHVTCQHASLVTTVTQHGNNVTIRGNVTAMTMTSCDPGRVHVLLGGTLEAHAVAPTGNSTLTSSGAELTVEADTIFGSVHCIYTTNNTHIGTLTAGSSPTVHIDTAQIPRTGGSFLCGSSGEWTGTFVVSHPKDIVFH